MGSTLTLELGIGPGNPILTESKPSHDLIKCKNVYYFPIIVFKKDFFFPFGLTSSRILRFGLCYPNQAKLDSSDCYSETFSKIARSAHKSEICKLLRVLRKRDGHLLYPGISN